MRKVSLLALAALFCTLQLLAQNRTVTGKVVDAKDGAPLSGVTVTVKNTNVNTVTDATGSFSINAPERSTLVFSYVGYQALERAAAGVVNVSLTPGEGGLSEVVVTGYRTSTKREFVGSANTIKSDRIKDVPIASFDQSLQGQAPGILVQSNSGQPGAAAAVVIRGKGSVLGSTTPLYVLDGVQITAGDFATLNPGDFESVSILKDASATSIYGSRGANGVVVITSRKGRAGAPRISYDAQYGFSTQPENRLRVMNSTEKLDYELANGNPFGWSTAQVDSLKKINTDWEDVFFRTGRTANHVLSAAGGTGKTTYFLSGSLFDQSGTVRNTGLKRYTGRANVETSTGAVTFGINSTFGYSDFTNTSEANTGIATPLNAIRWLNPYETVYDANGNYTQMTSGQPHALQELLENNNLRGQYKGVGNIYLNYAAPFLEGLSFRTNWGGDFRMNETSSFINPTTFTGQFSVGGRGSYSRGANRYFRYTGTTSASYNKDLGNDHTFGISLYNEIVKNKSRNFQFTGFGLGGPFQNEAGITPGNATNGFIPQVGGNGSISALLSYFTDVRYSFKNRYFVNFGARRDGSSRFGADRKWANFGSVGASWIVSDEAFMAPLKNTVFNELKFKVSYGSAGNQEGIDDFQSRELFNRAVYNGNSGLTQTQLANPELQWERRTTFNTGFELTTLKGRLRAGAEFYNALTTDLFLDKQLSRTTGFPSLLSNLGALQNRGVEAFLDGDLIRTKNFTWKANLSLTRNQNKIKRLADGQNEIIRGISINRVGESINSIYVVRYAGVNPQNGNAQYLDKDGKVTEVYNPNDRVIVGSFEAPLFGGFGSTVNFKGFEVNAFFSFVKGNEIFNNDRVNVENPAYLFDNLSADLVKEWRRPGDITNIPRPGNAFRSGTTRFVEKGDFLRLRNASVSYIIPKQWARTVKMNSARLFIQGQNLVTWTDFRGFDPEINTGSLIGAQYPALRTVTFGLNVGF